MPTFGSTVAKAYGAASAPPPARALYNDDFPAFGSPTKPKRSTAGRLSTDVTPGDPGQEVTKRSGIEKDSAPTALRRGPRRNAGYPGDSLAEVGDLFFGVEVVDTGPHNLFDGTRL